VKPIGVADFTPSSALDIGAQSPLWRDDICLESGASSTIAQVGFKQPGKQTRCGFRLMASLRLRVMSIYISCGMIYWI
jgi:hypothetical protein